jgi:hypothetical protein
MPASDSVSVANARDLLHVTFPWEERPGVPSFDQRTTASSYRPVGFPTCGDCGMPLTSQNGFLACAACPVLIGAG